MRVTAVRVTAAPMAVVTVATVTVTAVEVAVVLPDTIYRVFDCVAGITFVIKCCIAAVFVSILGVYYI